MKNRFWRASGTKSGTWRKDANAIIGPLLGPQGGIGANSAWDSRKQLTSIRTPRAGMSWEGLGLRTTVGAALAANVPDSLRNLASRG